MIFIKGDFLVVRQNNGIMDLIRHLNYLSSDNTKKKSIKTEKDLEIFINSKDEAIIKDIKNRLRYPYLKKIIIYIMYRLSIDEPDNVIFDINEFLSLKGLTNQTNNVKTLKNNLKILEVIFFDGMDVKIKEAEFVDGSPIIKIKKILPRDREVILDTFNWGRKLSKHEQFTYFPKEVFQMDKLSLDLLISILIRFRGQYKTMCKNGITTFALSMDSILKGVDVTNPSLKGSMYSIKRIDKALKYFSEELRLFTWDYRGKELKDLPFRKKIKYYKRFMLDFDIKDGKYYKILEDKYNNVA